MAGAAASALLLSGPALAASHDLRRRFQVERGNKGRACVTASDAERRLDWHGRSGPSPFISVFDMSKTRPLAGAEAMLGLG